MDSEGQCVRCMGMRTTDYDLIIVGAGIAGLTAAIYASRKRMDYAILSSDFGGQFMVSGEVLNYPGIVKTTGVEFRSIMEEQITFNNITVQTETVTNIQQNDGIFTVACTSGTTYTTKAVIMATGGKARSLGVSGEKEFEKKGVTYCAICDGPLFSEKKVAVVGGGNSALEAVDFLKSIASEIHLLVRGDQLKGYEYLKENVIEYPNVTLHYKTSVEEIKGDTFVDTVRIRENGEEQDLPVDGVFVQIGRVPNTEPVRDLVTCDETGHIVIDCNTHTSVSGVFAAGDCASGTEYQYVISAGQGCMALIKAAMYIANQKHE